jgi:ABC-type nitrate/sulfonate/bicarbonate transport system ATPase subunit
MKIQRAYHRFGASRPPTIDITNVELDWKGEATLFAPSGAGKTTLFRLLAGWYEANDNSCCNWDLSLNPYRDVRFVGGHRALLPWKTVGKNIVFQFPGFSTRSMLRSLGELGLNSCISSMYPYELSLGMYKRVELFLAVLAKPKILLLDEFYSSIGDDQKNDVRRFMAEHRKEQVTWIVAHEEKLRDWIAGPQFAFVMSGQTVTGIRRI